MSAKIKKTDEALVKKFLERSEKLRKLNAEHELDKEKLKKKYKDGLFAGPGGVFLELQPASMESPNREKMRKAGIWDRFAETTMYRKIRAFKKKGA